MMENPRFELFAAPLQGVTDRRWRHAHAGVAGEEGRADLYFAPFVRVEHGLPRNRDLRDVAAGPSVLDIPQVIFRDCAEFELLVDALIANGHSHIDLNLGCPFPPQWHKGRGAAMPARAEVLAQVAAAMAARSGVSFSVKMRPGIKEFDDWRQSVEYLNSMTLTHVTIHPRTAVMQYRGTPSLDTFAEMTAEIRHPIVYNGDIATVHDINRIRARFPQLAGIMVGRALISRPLLFAEWRRGVEVSDAEQRDAVLAIHEQLLADCRQTLCGDAQIRLHMNTYWEYAGDMFSRQEVKDVLRSLKYKER